MTRDRTSLMGAALALTVLAALIATDVAIPPGVVFLSALFGIAPLIACAVVGPTGTAVIAGLALLATIVSDTRNDAADTPQQTVRILDAGFVGAAAVAIAAVRVRRERRFAQVSAIAEVAQRAILPVLPVRVGHVAISARYQSAARHALVGGDLFDCYHSREHVRLLIGDVRGKGIAGVEQAARVIRAFRQSAALRATLTEVAEEMDDYLAAFFDEEEFVTVLLVDVTDPRRLHLVSRATPAPSS